MSGINRFNNMIGGVNGEAKVPKLASNPRDTISIMPSSHYNIDYILNSYRNFITRELSDAEKNITILKNPDFQNFLYAVSNFTDKIANKRQNNPEGIGINKDPTDFKKGMKQPIGSKTVRDELLDLESSLLNLYQELSTTIKFEDPSTKQIYNMIQLDPTTGETIYGIQGYPKIFNFYFEDFQNNEDMVTNFKSDIDLIEGLKDSYEGGTVAPVEEPVVQEIQKDYLETMTRFNYIYDNGGYQDRYEIVEKLLNDIVVNIDNAQIANYTEANIITKPHDISSYYENLKFNESDIDEAIITPIPGSSDLINYDDAKKDIEKIIDTIATNTTTIANTKVIVGLSPGTILSGNPSETLKELYQTQKQIKTIPATDELLKLMYSTIYSINIDGEKQVIVKYNDPEERKKRLEEMNKEQTTFLEKIRDPDPIPTTNVLKHLWYKTRYNRYRGCGVTQTNPTPDCQNIPDVGYEVEQILKGGGTTRKLYDFNDKLRQTIPSIQTGGIPINLCDITDEIENETKELKEMQTDVDELNNFVDEQNKEFFENKSVYDIRNIEQTNIYLITMMNILFVTEFLTTKSDQEFMQFRKEFATKLSQFQKDLNKIFDIIHSQISIQEKYTQINKLLAENATNPKNFIDFLKTSDLVVDPAFYPIDAMINLFPNINTITQLRRKYRDIDEVMNILGKIFTIQSTFDDPKKTIEKKYQDLIQFNAQLINLDKKLRSTAANINQNISTINEIYKNIGDQLDRNITTANSFARRILFLLNNYDSKVHIFREVSQMANETKRRLDVLNICVNKLSQIVNQYDEKTIQNWDQLFNDNLPEFYTEFKLDDIYDDYKKYVDNAKNQPKNLSTTISLNKKAIVINDKVKTIASKMYELITLLGVVYQEAIEQKGGKTIKETYLVSPDILVENNIIKDTETRSIDNIYPMVYGIMSDGNSIITRSMKGNYFYEPQPPILTTLIADDSIKYLDSINQSYLFLHPEIMLRLNIPVQIQKLFDIYGNPISRILQDYADIITDGNDDQTLSNDAISQMLEQLYISTNKHLQLIQLYGNSDNRIEQYIRQNQTEYNEIANDISDQNKDKINKYVNDAKKILINTNNGPDHSTGIYTLDKNKINDAIVSYLDELKVTMSDINEISKYIFNGFTQFGASLYRSLFLELSSIYQIINAYILTNDSYSEKIDDITKEQFNITNLAKQTTFVDEMDTISKLKSPNIMNIKKSLQKLGAKKDENEAINAKELFENYGKNLVNILSSMIFSLSDKYKFGEDFKRRNLKLDERDLGGLINNGEYLIKPPIEGNDPIVLKFKEINVPLNFKKDDQIRMNELQSMSSIVQTIVTILQIMPHLVQVTKELQSYSSMNLATKQKTLIDSVEKMKNVYTMIKNNEETTYLSQLLFPQYFVFDDAINNIKYGIEYKNTFGQKADTVYDFVNELNNYYYTFTNKMIEKLTNLDGTISTNARISLFKYIVDYVVKNNIKPNEIYSKELSAYIEKLPVFVIGIVEELYKAINRISSDLDKVAYNKLDSDEIYDDYYSNTDSSTFDIYFLMVLSKVKISPEFREADTHINKIYHINEMTKIDGEYVNENNEMIDEIITLDESKDPVQSMRELLNSKIEQLEINANTNIVGDFIDELKKKNETEINKLLDKIMKDKGPNIGTFSDDLEDITDKTDYNIIMQKTDDEVYNNIRITIRDMVNSLNRDTKTNFIKAMLVFYYKMFLDMLSNKIDSELNKIGKIFDIIIQKTNNDDVEKNIYSPLMDYITNTIIDSPTLKKSKPSKFIIPPLTSNVDVTKKKDIKSILYLSKTKEPELRDAMERSNEMMTNLTDKVKTNLADNLNQVDQNINIMTELAYETFGYLSQDREMISQRIAEFKQLMAAINLVMFDEYFKQTAFIGKNELLDRMNDVMDTYKMNMTVIEDKIRGIIVENSRQKLMEDIQINYINYKGSVGSRIGDDPIFDERQIYKQMSFGLVEYYLDIVEQILECLNKPFTEMSSVEKYLYKYHFILLNRINVLFQWIINEYLEDKESEEKQTKPIKPILRKKIELPKTKNDVRSIFIEFNGIKDLLDAYQATFMPKVSLHLRINDFAIKDSQKNPDPALRDYDPSDPEYLEWIHRQVFVPSKTNPRKLLVNFHNVPERPPDALPMDDLYYETYNKMQEGGINKGIGFERIYDRLRFPDADIISNYMSLAPNIKQGRGTMIMTYGYSGVGKSATLFGVRENKAKNVKQQQGILQTTMDQFGDDIKIYLRVYEIYGLGTQFNYYWNQSQSDYSQSQLKCYPDIYQILIHHDIDNSGPILIDNGGVPIDNRSDILSYILNLEDPPNGKPELLQNDQRAKTNNDLNKLLTGNKFTKSTYIPIDRSHYRNFRKFVDEQIERTRGADLDIYSGNFGNAGVMVTQVYQDRLLQVKGTVNNDKSSRSILVYDFQIELIPDKKDPNKKLFVPFVIYDLPGKEDLFKTYVEKTINVDPETVTGNIRYAFQNIPGDVPIDKPQDKDIQVKERKTSYVLNPFLIPTYDNNYDVIITTITNLDNELDSNYRQKLLNDILNYEFKNLTVDPQTKGIDEPKSGTIVKNMYKSEPTTFTDLFTFENIDIKLAHPSYDMIYTYGIFEYEQVPTAKSFFIQLMVVVMKTLMKFKLFDVIVKLIHDVVHHVLPNDKTWEKIRIYAFFEAFYINENILGLLQYLISDILEPGSNVTDTFDEQPDETAAYNTEYNLRLSSVYRFLSTLDKNRALPFDIPGIKVPEKIRDLSTTNPFEKKEIMQFLANFNIQVDGSFIKQNMLVQEAYDAIRMTIQRSNKVSYDSNKIFRDGTKSCVFPPLNKDIIDPNLPAPNPTTIGQAKTETNRPLLQDFLEPYKQKILYYYIFYVVSNTQKELKAEEQIKLLDNSMKFITILDKGDDPTQKKTRCAQ